VRWIDLEPAHLTSQQVICEHKRRHSFDDRHSAWYHTWVMTAFAREGYIITRFIDGLLVLHDSGNRFESDIEIDIHAIGDAALDSPLSDWWS
jgi:hypothetical protein